MPAARPAQAFLYLEEVVQEERYTSPPGWVAERMGVSRSTVERWAKAGEIPAVTIGGRILVHWRELKRRIDEEARKCALQGEQACLINGKAARIGGSILRARAAKELDNLLAQPIGVKQKQ